MALLLTGLAWAWSTLMALMMLGGLISGAPASALAFGAAALVSFPALWRALKARAVHIRSGWKFAASLGLFVIGIAIAPTTQGARTEDLATAASGKSTPDAANKPEQIAGLTAKLGSLPDEDHDGRIALLQRLQEVSGDDADYQGRLSAALEAKARFELIRDHPEQAIEIVKTKGTKAGFGNVLIMDFTLRNFGLSHLKDFVIRCDHSGPSGTVMDSNSITLYEVVEAGQTRTIRKVNMGLINPQSQRTNCRIDNASIH